MPLDQVIPGLIGLTLLGASTTWFGRLWWTAHASKRWPTTTGRVTESKVILRKRGTRGVSASHRLRFEFEVDGTRYAGDRRCFGDFIEGNVAIVQELAQRLATDASVTVHYDPRDPKRSTLEPRVDLRVPMAAIVSALIAAAIAASLLGGLPPA